MSSAKFTRDEAILALDVLYSQKMKVSATSIEMIKLSELLRRLPIHPTENRREDFRSSSGITKQLNLFRTGIKTGNKSSNVGNIFFEVAFTYENREQELHNIAQAIRRNEEWYNTLFGGVFEDIGFPEGILLGHLHKILENREGKRIHLKDRCEICGLQPHLYYRDNFEILSQHLIVNPIEMNLKNKYNDIDFVTVCPNCHEVLHRSRPWITKNNLEDLLL